MSGCPFSDDKPSPCVLVRSHNDLISRILDVNTMSELLNILQEDNISLNSVLEGLDLSKYGARQLEKLALLNDLTGGDKTIFDHRIAQVKDQKQEKPVAQPFIRGSSAFNIYDDQSL